MMIVALALAGLASSVAAADDAGDLPSIRGLSVEPEEIHLRGANRRQQVLITGEREDGRLIDLTGRCELQIVGPGAARLDGTIVAGVSDGTTQLLVRAGGHQVRVPIRVAGFNEYPPVHFGDDVVPILSKLGCNSGGCHGKSGGKNGFKLSVFGFNPPADFVALVKEARGRRLFPASPEKSLLLVKATAQVPHGGGQRMQTGSSDYEVLFHWIEQGMPAGRDDAPKLVGLQVSPAERVLEFSSSQQILATAVYSNGNRRDVSSAASFTSNATLVAEVEAGGLVHVGKSPGEVAVTVNYMGQVAAVRVQVPRPDAPEVFPDLPVNNPVDPLVWDKLEKMGILPSPLSDDATFLRRVYLDTIGTLPSPSEVREFLTDDDSQKRARAIDRVLERQEFADFWALKWADILLVNRETLGDRGAFEFHRWIRQQFARNRPYDQWVRELITATGNSAKDGPVNFYRSLRTKEELARAVSQAFLGVRVECAQCHHHPFEKWARQDFYGLAGYFNGLERKNIGPQRELVYHGGLKQTHLPVSGELVATRPLSGDTPTDLERGDPRVHLASWLTAPDNPWFARLVANRLWKHYLGRGLVEPEDDLRSTNPATNEALLDYLAAQVVDSGYDLKALMRTILNSRVYQLSGAVNDSNRDDDQNYSHHYVKRLPAEVLLDAINAVAGTNERFPGRPPGTRAIELWDNRMPSYFLDIFGRPERTTPCECGRSSAPTMSQALHLMNAPELESKIADLEGRIGQLIASGAEPARITEELCLAAIGRPPGEKEKQVAELLFSQDSARKAAEDFMWALLNSYDFLFIQ